MALNGLVCAEVSLRFKNLLTRSICLKSTSHLLVGDWAVDIHPANLG